MRPGWKMWRDNLLIPDQHNPGVTKVRKQGEGKHKKFIGSEHHSSSKGGNRFWPIGRWAGGKIQ
jgi:hypothetical protein